MNEEQEKLQKQLQALYGAINSHVQDYRSGTFGRVATIIDASIHDENQKKSLKDLVSDAIYGPSYWNAIRQEFDLLCKAHGFKLYEDAPLKLAEPANPYE